MDNFRIFATGVHLQAIEVDINGQKQWRWVAIGFEEDSFHNEKEIEVFDYASTFEGLFRKEDKQNV